MTRRYPVGRLKDMLLRRGEKIYPRQIKEFLYHHPAIAEVQVFGVPDNRYGEEICAWIVLKPGASFTDTELRDFRCGQIAHLKGPRHIRLVNALPMTVTGKAQKFMMRKAIVRVRRW